MFDLKPEDLPGFDCSAQDLTGDWIPGGFQIRKVRRPAKKGPPWARDHTKLILHVAGPKVMRRVRIAYLYFCVGVSSADIAQFLHIKRKAVESVIYELRHKNIRHRISHVQPETLEQLGCSESL